MFVVPQPEVLLMKAKENFDEQGQLTDAVSRELIHKLSINCCWRWLI